MWWNPYSVPGLPSLLLGCADRRITPKVKRSYCSFEAVPFPSYPLSLPLSRSVPAVQRAGHLPNQDGGTRSLARAAQSSRYDFRLSKPMKFARFAHSLPPTEYSLVVSVRKFSSFTSFCIFGDCKDSHCLPLPSAWRAPMFSGNRSTFVSTPDNTPRYLKRTYLSVFVWS